MSVKLQMNKPIEVLNIADATVPDAVASIGNLKLNSDGTLTIAMHYYSNESDADADINSISFKTYENINMPNLENQIIAFVKTQPEFDVATDIPAA